MTDRKERPMVYLDHSATTPVDPRVAEVVKTTMLETWGNPSSRYKKGNEAKLVLEKAREQISSMIHADSANLFFTSGGTEADNLAVLGVMHAARRNGGGDHFITSAIEHSAILRAAEALERDGFRVTYLPINGDGRVEPDALRKAIDEKAALVSVMHVNNELGSIQPIEELAAICREAGVLFHTDAVQSFGKVALNVSDVPIDLVSMSSHKIYGPKGVGAIYIRSGVDIEPRALGGGQEKGMRTGTENMPGIAGFGAAAELCAAEFDEDARRLGALRDQFYAWIREEVGGDVRLNGSADHRLYSNLNLMFPGVEAESLLLALDLDGIAVSVGSACSSGSTKPSHVLLALGLSEPEAHASIRLTLGRSNNEENLKYAAKRIGYHVRRLREMSL